MDTCLCPCTVGSAGENNKVGELLCGHQVTGCHGLHSWQSGLEKLL